ncbi:hypothetical protein J2741_001577 [Methanolinea mesophila]|uniref:hypothetical protein n=1 Tax=Methanolinea mesophila TaxID=547055 RepID=UPI001AE4E162|nr:hypothetical protein [Methanolinea mesophila]MBP1929030.1 hypothetical protein [Methanolinea mesophila]
MKFTLFMAALLMGSLMAGVVLADSGEPAVQETQGFVTSTAMQVFGTAAEIDSIAVDMNDGYTIAFPPAPPLPPTSVIYSSAYSENTLADQGLVTYMKSADFDTAGMAVPNQYNLVTEKLVEFVGTGTGRMTSEEQVTMDGASTGQDAPDLTLTCPFAAGDEGGYNPPFCNIVQEGSVVDITTGSLSTATRERFIMIAVPDTTPSSYGIAWPYPLADPGTESDYSIALTGFGDIPASGSATAYISARVQEGRDVIMDGTGPYDERYPKSEDLAYSESTTVSGDITLFEKNMNYLGKLTGTGRYIIDLPPLPP